MNTKEKIEIMQAWIDGKTIQITYRGLDAWADILPEPEWDFQKYEYRIKPKQKVKKIVKYLCFEHYEGTLCFAAENSIIHTSKLKSQTFFRIPEFDKIREIEVEE